MERVLNIDYTELHDGRCRLYRGDSLDILDILPDSSVDCIIADPPYSTTTNRTGNSAMKYQQSGTNHIFEVFVGEGREQFTNIIWHFEWIRRAYRVLKAGAPLFIFTDFRMVAVPQLAANMANLQSRGGCFAGLR